MKVERKERKTFTPITITLETEKEATSMYTISLICTHETLEECCNRMKNDVDTVSNFGVELARKVNKFLDC